MKKLFSIILAVFMLATIMPQGVMAASSANEQDTQEWLEEIKAAFPDMEVMCDYLTLGISCHTGEGALGIGCSCRPRR